MVFTELLLKFRVLLNNNAEFKHENSDIEVETILTRRSSGGALLRWRGRRRQHHRAVEGEGGSYGGRRRWGVRGSLAYGG